MVVTADAVDRGQEAFGRQAWADAFARLSAADRAAPLEPEHLELLATAAHLIGRDDDSADVLARAHHEFMARGDAARPPGARSGWASAF